MPGWRKLGASVTGWRPVFLSRVVLAALLGIGGLWLVERELLAQAEPHVILVEVVGLLMMASLGAWSIRGQLGKGAQSAAQPALADSEEWARMILDHAMDAVIVMDAQGLVVSWNPQAEALLGWAAHEIVGKDVRGTIVPPQHREAYASGVARHLATGEDTILNRRIEITALRKDGTEFPIELAVTTVPRAGRPLYSAFIRDITSQKDVLRRLQERENFFRLLSEQLPIGVFEINEQGRATYTNKTWQSILLTDAEDLFGLETVDLTRNWLEWFHPEDRAAMAKAWVASRESYTQMRQECRLATTGGETRWAQVLLWPLGSDAGFQYFGTLEDITDRKRTTAYALHLLHEGRFEFRTPAEAKALAELLAYAFPDPARSQVGLLELLVNGVEHGNLAISFDDKTVLLKAGTLDEEIARRLALPEYAGKQVRVTLTRTDKELRLVIVDDGQGFDWRAYLAEDHLGSEESHGRGIAIAKDISFDAVQYRGCGNHVEVATKLSDGGSDFPKAA